MKNELELENIMQSEYESAHDFLYGFVNYERGSDWKYNDDHFDLSRVSKLLHVLGDPHKKGRFVHIAGTNGKGSVAALVASALVESGYKTGLYTSPHLTTFRERIKINGEMISKDDIVGEVKKIRDAAVGIEGLTFFDVWTVLAFSYFASRSTDISIIEVGLGGRLDSTNVIEPDVSVITSISMDHLDKLGGTLEKIALEKAGIIKPGVPVVCAPQADGVRSVIEEKAKQSGSDFVYIGKEASFTIDYSVIHYSGLSWELNYLTIPLNGAFQNQNSALALAALEILAAKFPSITAESARKGIKNVSWPGRLQTLALNPEIIVDGASNIDAMTAVSEYLLERRPAGKIVVLFGICGDKEIERLIGILGTVVSQFVFTRADNPRALNADELMRLYGSETRDIYESDPVTALKKAASLAGPNGLVIVTGSLYLVGEILKNYE
ncbi:bifunctional folylpolyglutamate synthase/dihydrofolate synthase [Candidatus Latescibacterota bacterium]